MYKFFYVDVPNEQMNGTQHVLAYESDFGIYRSVLKDFPEGLSFHRIAGELARLAQKHKDFVMPKESELGFAILRLLQEGLIDMGCKCKPAGPVVLFKKLHEDAKLPRYANAGDAGADVYSVEEVVIEPGQTAAVSLGFSVEVEPGYEIQVRSRSGLSLKGVVVANAPGTIDSGYRGECKVILHNNNKDLAFSVRKGDRIAQFVVKQAPQASFYVVDELSNSDRGSGGFGSTGLQ